MSLTEHIQQHNARYAARFDRSTLALPPARRWAIVACMDARLTVEEVIGIGTGDAHIIRNAGGLVTDDAIRSLVISYKLLGTREWFVVHHTNCGMETFTDEVMRDLLATSLETAALDEQGWRDQGRGPGATEGDPGHGVRLRSRDRQASPGRLRDHRRHKRRARARIRPLMQDE